MQPWLTEVGCENTANLVAPDSLKLLHELLTGEPQSRLGLPESTCSMSDKLPGHLGALSGNLMHSPCSMR